MKKNRKLIIFIIISLLVLLLLGILVWGKTLQMAEANRLLLAGSPRQAQAIYEHLAAASPDSPYILHNLGLAFYKQGQYDKAVANLDNAAKKAQTSGLSSAHDFMNRLCYNLGNAFFKLAEKSFPVQGGQGANSYQTALENYQKAIEANRGDLDAKYNYELTRIRLKQAQNEQSSQDQQKDQKQTDKQQNNKKQNNGTRKNDQSSKNQSGQNSSAPQQAGQMNKEEAEALLKLMKSRDQSKAPVTIGNEAPPKQDW